VILMAKARSRTAARKIKDRWKSKKWYNISAPPSFDNVTIAETLADEPDKLINRVTEVSLQDLTNDFRRSHIKLFFKVYAVEDGTAKTQFIGHTLTSDYLRRMIRRKRSKIDAVYDVKTRDGAKIRIKPFATTDRRIQNSQKRAIREAMKKTITLKAKKSTLSEFIKIIIDGRIGSEIYKSCKTLYPVKRVEIYKTEIINQPTIEIEEEKPEPIEEETTEQKKKEPKESDSKDTTEKQVDEVDESEAPLEDSEEQEEEIKEDDGNEEVSSKEESEISSESEEPEEETKEDDLEIDEKDQETPKNEDALVSDDESEIAEEKKDNEESKDKTEKKSSSEKNE